MTGLVWLDGHALDAGQARIDPADRGFLLGDGVFETIRAAGAAALHLQRHLARLRAGADMLRMALAWTDSEIGSAIGQVLDAGGRPDSVVRLTCSRGPALRGLLPAAPAHATLLITAGPLPPAAAPAHLIIAVSTRRNERSPLARIKSLNYLDSILARQEAAARGADDAILLNTRGDVAEASAGNVFLVAQGETITPPVEDGALPGIARALLLEAGLAVERRVSVAMLAEAEAGFVSSSLGVRPVAGIEGRTLRPFDPLLLAAARRVVVG